MRIKRFSVLRVEKSGAFLREGMNGKRCFDGLVGVGGSERIDIREDLDLKAVGACWNKRESDFPESANGFNRDRFTKKDPEMSSTVSTFFKDHRKTMKGEHRRKL